MLALAQDFRIVRADRGFFCLSEVDLGLPLAPGMLALIECRMSPATFRDTIPTGLRVGGADPGKVAVVVPSAAMTTWLPWSK
jgi:enoyl-CoA hydratase/carnithine racemase